MDQLYTQYKRLLFSLAYQMTGSWSDAEDAVHDVFLKVYDKHPAGLAEEPKAYLCKMVINRCRDLYKSARKQREQYFGEWLPEPVPTSEDDPLEMIVRDELLSYGTLVLLEKLSPAERAVFVLREALGFDYTGIAEVIGKNEVNCRKLYSRAKGKMGIDGAELIHTISEKEDWIRQFVAALEQNEMEQVVSMLASDVVLLSDGGGKINAAVHPIVSSHSVAKFLRGIIEKMAYFKESFRFEISKLNGQAGLIILSGEQADSVVFTRTINNKISEIYVVRNPDKLHHVKL